MRARRRLLAFVITVLVLIVLLAPAWPFLAPGYTRLLVAVSNGVASSSITMAAVDNSIIISHAAAEVAPISVGSLPFQAGLFLVVILIIATPGLGVRRRLGYALAAVVLTFGLHVVGVLFMSTRTRALRPAITLFASIGIDLFPILIWGVLCARYWRPAGEAEQTRGS